MHTQGKWKVQTVGLMWAVTPAPIKRDSVDICSGSVHNENWCADAALIAAAPSMLLALHRIREQTVPGDLIDTLAKLAIKEATKEFKNV